MNSEPGAPPMSPAGPFSAAAQDHRGTGSTGKGASEITGEIPPRMGASVLRYTASARCTVESMDVVTSEAVGYPTHPLPSLPAHMASPGILGPMVRCSLRRLRHNQELLARASACAERGPWEYRRRVRGEAGRLPWAALPVGPTAPRCWKHIESAPLGGKFAMPDRTNSRDRVQP